MGKNMTDFITCENYKQHTIGKKAKTLFVLKSKGFNVPPFFCVNSQPERQQLLAQLDDDKLYSVRSSAFCEDSPQYSFAGQFDTFLSVSKNDVFDRISDCFASVDKPNVLSYCKQNGIAQKKLSMTVIIQQMAAADHSGVVFSANPQGILNESVIVYGKGTGDNVVDEKTDVITCFFNRNDNKYFTEKSSTNAPTLSDALIRRLIRLCEKAEKSFGKLIDIEFAVSGKSIYILQVRPITTISADKELILDNSNIVESYPGISLPLTISFVKQAYCGVFKGLARRVLRDKRIVEKYNNTYYNMTGSANGRVYYKISNWYTLLSLLPMNSRIIPLWQDMMGVSDRHVAKDLARISAFKRLCTYKNVVSEALNVRKNMEKLNASFPEMQKYFREHFTEDITLAQIKELYDTLSDKVLSIWDITLLNDLYAFVFTGLLKSQIKRSGAADAEKKVNDFISGISNIESLKPIKAMMILASSDRAMLEKLSSSKDERQLEQRLRAYPGFRKKFYRYISLYGDRSPEELKLETVTFRESPLLLIKKIADLSSDPVIFERSRRSILKKSRSKNEQLLSGIRTRKHLIRFLAGKASVGIMNREISRLDRTRLYGMVRSMFLRAGRIFFENGSIDDTRDVFYLTVDEVFSGDPSQFRRLIAARKQDYLSFAKMPAFSRLVFSGDEFDRTPHGSTSVSKAAGDSDILCGTPSSAGKARGEAVVVKDACCPPETKGKILVAKMTDPGWVFLLSGSKGIISEKGSLLSHTAIISRELKIPAVVGVKDAAELIKDGDIIELDGNSGKIRICRKDK